MEISSVTTKEIALMKVSGSHTWAIQKFGIPSLLPKKSDLYRDRVVLFRQLQKINIQGSDIKSVNNAIITNYGDLIRLITGEQSPWIH